MSSVALALETKDASENRNIVTQPELIRSAEAEKELISDRTSSIQEENAADENFEIRFPRSVKDNKCIKKFVNRIIYNYYFAVPLCKIGKGCKEKMMTVNFSNGKTIAIAYDCFK